MGKPEGKRCMTIKMKEMNNIYVLQKYAGVLWPDLVQNMDQWKALLNITNLCVP